MLNACPECGSQVSNQAAACPACGLSTTDSRMHVELTSKRLKVHHALAMLTTFIGMVWGFVGCGQAISAESEGPLILPTVVFTIGVAWLAVARVRIWWHHR